MSKTSMLYFSIIGTLLLSSCASLSSQNNDDENTKSRTAKINAQLGIAYLEQSDIPRAKKKLLLALQQDSTIPEPWYSMAYFLEATGDKPKANQYYINAIKVSHHRGDAENNYGTFLCRDGKYHEAINHFIVAAKDPNYLTPADAYENAGLCAARMKGNNHAADYFNKALSNDPERPVSLLGLAELHFKAGNFKLAQKELKQFSMVSPPTDRSMALNTKLSKVGSILSA